jgi:DNA-binding response OmpR family regulator
MGRSVLVAEDDLTTQKILRITLESAGYEVIATADGEATLEALEGWVPDCVVLDVMMPKYDGYQILRRIRDDPRTAQTPVVLLTARSTPEDLWRGWQEGIDYYLTKPFDTEELLGFMDRVVAVGEVAPQAGAVERASAAELAAAVETVLAPARDEAQAGIAPSVLVVDDDPAILRVLRLNLELEGYDVDTACNGAEALEYLERGRHDIVVLDVMMPKVDGFEVLRRIRENPGIADIPVILLTARSTEQDVWDGWQQGVDYYMTKPFDVEELLRSIDRLLAARSPKPDDHTL